MDKHSRIMGEKSKRFQKSDSALYLYSFVIQASPYWHLGKQELLPLAQGTAKSIAVSSGYSFLFE